MLCVWLREANRRRPSAKPNDPATERPFRKNVSPGNATTEVTAETTPETVAERRLRRAETALEVCQNFSPTIGLEPFDFPQSLLLDITGLDHLFAAGSESKVHQPLPVDPWHGVTPGERALIRRLVVGLGERHIEFSLAVAATIGAAWGLAHYPPRRTNHRAKPTDFPRNDLPVEGASLSELPVAALRLSAEALERLAALGLEQVGQLQSLPRSSLSSRLGTEVTLRLDQLEGRTAEVIVAYHPPALAAASMPLEFPTTRLEFLEQVFTQLLAQAIAALPPGEGVEQLLCRLRDEGGRRQQFAVGLFHATAQVEHLLGLVRLRLESMRWNEPVAEVQVEVVAAGTLGWQQRDLFASHHLDQVRQRTLLIDRLSNRLGRRAVLRAQYLSDAQPEYACRLEPLIPARLPGTPRGLRRRSPLTRKNTRKQSAQAHAASSTGLAAFSTENPACDPRIRPWRLLSRPMPIEVLSTAPSGSPERFVLHSHRAGQLGWKAKASFGPSSSLEPCGSDPQRIVRYWGPERIETAWWRGRLVRRDYYRVETADGRWFWLFRNLQTGRWFCHGSFG